MLTHTACTSRACRKQQGLTLIELLVGVAIVALLLAATIPNIATWMKAASIRSASESVLAAVFQARSAAVAGNIQVGAYLTSSLDSGCAVSDVGLNIVVATGNPTGQCGTAPITFAHEDLAGFGILLAEPLTTASNQVRTKATVGSGGLAATVFGGSGKLVPVGASVQIDIFLEDSSGCLHRGGKLRCLRVEVGAGGSPRICDPAVTAADDRRCTL